MLHLRTLYPLTLFDTLLRFLIILLGLAFVAFSGVLFFECVATYISELLGLSQKFETLKFLGISMGGVLIALQALMTYKRAKALEDTANAQVRATEEQAKANRHTERGQRQERLKNAIEHLGHTSDSVRLGGAYELFHLAQDTEDLRQTVLDILCAHIRRTTGESEYRKAHESKPSEEVQSLLTLLFVQEREVFKGLRINLQESWLNGTDLREACLWKAILTGVHLRGAKLDRAHLQRANLFEAHLEEASLAETRLQEANLPLVHMQGAYLHQARLQGANLMGAYLQAAHLRGAHLQGVILETRVCTGQLFRAHDYKGRILRTRG